MKLVKNSVISALRPSGSSISGKWAPLLEYSGHATATGKVLLADLTSVELRRLLTGVKLKPITGRTVTSRKVLEAQLESVREQAFATQYGGVRT